MKLDELVFCFGIHFCEFEVESKTFLRSLKQIIETVKYNRNKLMMFVETYRKNLENALIIDKKI